MANYDDLDLDWSWDGDIAIGDDGDIKVNNDDLVRSLDNEIQTAVKSEFDDWEWHPGFAANLSDFRGEPNTRQTGQAIQERVITSLVTNGIVKAEDLEVRVFPTSRTQVAITIIVKAASTPNNRLFVGEPVVTTLTYDTLENSVFFLPPSTIEREGR